jgi:hypothetical protein
MIETGEAWRRERRQRPVAYLYTTCTLCASVEERLSNRKHLKGKAFASHGARQNAAFRGSGRGR